VSHPRRPEGIERRADRCAEVLVLDGVDESTAQRQARAALGLGAQRTRPRFEMHVQAFLASKRRRCAQ
jgi:hypothetical protein